MKIYKVKWMTYDGKIFETIKKSNKKCLRTLWDNLEEENLDLGTFNHILSIDEMTRSKIRNLSK